MTGLGRTAARSVTYLAVMLAVFVGVLMALPEPVPPPGAADAALPEVSFAIVGVKVFDGEAFRPEQDVWIEGGRIRRVGEGLDLPEDLPRVDGSGRTLTPGLIDGHVHTWGSTLNDAVRFGVTTVLDQFMDPELAASKRPAREDLARIDAGRIADLVLVDGDLEQDLSRSTRIVAIWKDGYRVERSIEEEEAPVASPAPEATMISDFGDGVGAAFGAGWQAASDRMQGGSSTASLAARQGALRVEGEVVASGSGFPWSGAIYFPGDQPMQPVDFSDREALRFRTRGDGRTYTVMLFVADSAAAIPAAVPFTATPAWTEVEIPLARFPTATPGVVGGLAFVALAPPAGAYAFEIDDVEIR